MTDPDSVRKAAADPGSVARRRESPQVVVGDLDRPNIRLAVRQCRDDAGKREVLLDAVQAAKKPGIVYVATRRHAEEIAAELADVGVRAGRYHGGMAKREREAVQEAFMSGAVDVIVATSAFGTGIDKPDVRFVHHFDVPASLDAYYREVGPAGRDGEPAEALLVYRPEDLSLHERCTGGGSLQPGQLEEAAEAVRAAGMRKREEGCPARLLRDLERMRAYAELRDCRRRYLLEHFGRESAPCGHCDACEAGLPAAASPDEEPFPAKTRVVHGKLGKGTVLGYEPGRVTILFDAGGEKTLDLRFALERDLLRRP